MNDVECYFVKMANCLVIESQKDSQVGDTEDAERGNAQHALTTSEWLDASRSRSYLNHHDIHEERREKRDGVTFEKD